MARSGENRRGEYSGPAMRAAAIVVLAVLGAAVAGCAARAEPADPLAGLHVDDDAPLDLADDQDLELARADFAALPDDAPTRPAVRRRLADELARRLDLALVHGERDAGLAALRGLLALWSAAELAAPAAAEAGMAPYRAVLARARQAYARSGRDRETAAALCALVLADPAGAASYRAELEEIFAYADELATADDAPMPRAPRPIEILDGLIDVHPAPWVVDRLVALYLAHGAAAASRARRGGRGELGMARGDPAWRTAWHVTRALARGGRVGEAARAIEAIAGVGDDRELRERLRRIGAAGARAADWVLLAARFQSSDPRLGDAGAALAIAREAVRRFPRDAAAHLAAADSARLAGETGLAIRYYESGLALDPRHADATAALGRLHVERISALALSDRPGAAARLLRGFDRFHRAATVALGQPVEPDLADAQAAFGRGLASLGELEQARRTLTASIDRRPTLDALEALGTLALKQDRFDAAIDAFERALARPATDPIARAQQCRLLRLAAEAYDGAGRPIEARARERAALFGWRHLMETAGIASALAGDALVEQGKVLWQIGEFDAALVAFDAAVDVDPNGASVHADVVAFLVVRGQYERALDAYHGALGSREIGDYFKVYMSLWVTAEALRQGRPVDPLARDFLAAREGPLWYDDLARYAGGRIRLAALERRATTRSRRAELLYYSAVLDRGLVQDPARARRRLERVVATDMVMFFEYDMARHWLRHGFGRAPRPR